MHGLLEQIREAIRRDDRTRYRIAQDTGISESQLCRLMNGTTGLSIENAEVLLEHLGYEVKIQRTRKGKA